MATNGYPLYAPLEQPLSNVGVILPGAKCNVYAAGTLTPVDSFSDYALTTPHTNPVIADANGRFPVIYLDPNVLYKLDITDSDDVSITGYPIDNYRGVRDFDQASLGSIIWPITDAEIAANATLVNSFHQSGDARRYGADPTGVTDSKLAIQTAINQNSHNGNPAWIPAGEYKIDSGLYFHYHAVDNEDFNSADRTDGRIIFRGDGCGVTVNLQNRDIIGTTIIYTPSSGNAMNIGDTTREQARALIMERFNIYAATTDSTIYVNTLSQTAEFSHIGIVNDYEGGTNGNGFYAEYLFSTFLRNIHIVGPRPLSSEGGSGPDDGIGFWWTPVNGAGGAVKLQDVHARGFYVGFMFGDEYDESRTLFGGTWDVSGCEGNYNLINWWFRHGVHTMRLVDCWGENADADYDNTAGASGADHHDMKFTDSCAGRDHNYNGDVNNPLVYRPGQILIVGGQYSSGLDQTSQFELGQQTGTVGQDRIGNIQFRDVSIRGSSDWVFRRYNHPANGKLILANLQLGFNNKSGGVVRIDDDEPQYGDIEVIGASGWKTQLSTQWCQEDNGSTDMGGKYFTGDPWFTTITGGTGAQTIDYSDAENLPPLILVRPGAGNVVTVKLPVNYYTPGSMQTTIVTEDSTTGEITIDVDDPPTWAASTAYVSWQKIINSAGDIYYAQNDGTSGPDPGDEPMGSGEVTGADGITWKQTKGTNEVINGAASVNYVGAPGRMCVQVYGRYGVWTAFQTA